MAKTYEALKKAEEEKRKMLGQVTIDVPAQPVVGRSPSVVDLKPLSVERRLMKIPARAIDEYRRMKYRILSTDPSRALKSILFCSSQWEEGNSTVVSNFAITLASEGDRVILVDADLRHPSLHSRFSLSKERGLIDLAYGKCTVNEVLKGTIFDNLFIITCGTSYSNFWGNQESMGMDNEGNNPIVISETKTLDSSIARMKAQADWVLFDSPPVNSYADSIALAGKVDGVVMVVEAEKTRWEVVQATKHRLENGNGKIVGVILNKRRYHIPKWLYKRL